MLYGVYLPSYFFYYPHLFISASLSLHLDGLPPSWRWLKVAALETMETTQELEKQPWEVIKSTASSCQIPDIKGLLTAAGLKQYLGCQNKSKVQDYR